MSDDPIAKIDSAQAWSEFCKLLEKAGETILRDGLARSSFDPDFEIRCSSGDGLFHAGFFESTSPSAARSFSSLA